MPPSPVPQLTPLLPLQTLPPRKNNCPLLAGDLDDAILDRMDEALEFDLPGQQQRRQVGGRQGGPSRMPRCVPPSQRCRGPLFPPGYH
jgi:hypothetical protein